MTQDEADRELGKIVRGLIAKAVPLDFSKTARRYVTVDLDGFGEVLVAIDVCGTVTATKH